MDQIFRVDIDHSWAPYIEDLAKAFSLPYAVENLPGYKEGFNAAQDDEEAAYDAGYDIGYDEGHKAGFAAGLDADDDDEQDEDDDDDKGCFEGCGLEGCDCDKLCGRIPELHILKRGPWGDVCSKYQGDYLVRLHVQKGHYDCMTMDSPCATEHYVAQVFDTKVPIDETTPLVDIEFFNSTLEEALDGTNETLAEWGIPIYVHLPALVDEIKETVEELQDLRKPNPDMFSPDLFNQTAIDTLYSLRVPVEPYPPYPYMTIFTEEDRPEPETLEELSRLDPRPESVQKHDEYFRKLSAELAPDRTAPEASDLVNQPSHYMVEMPVTLPNGKITTASVECSEVAIALGLAEDALLWNIFKYIWRHNAKGGDQDIFKAGWYMDKWRELNE